MSDNLTDEEKLALAKFRSEKAQVNQGNGITQGPKPDSENVSSVPGNKDVISTIRSAAKQAKSRKGFVIVPHMGGITAKNVSKLIQSGISPIDLFYGDEEVNE